MKFTKEFTSKIINKTFPGLTFYYRDAELSKDQQSKYQARQVIRNGFFLDVSSHGGKLMQNTRFIIASNRAAPMFQLNPAVEKWRLHTINLNTYFQVLDIWKEGEQIQILLLQIPKEGLALFQSSKISIQKQIIKKARESFAEKMKQEPVAALQEADWLKRTAFPVGLNAEDEFFPLEVAADDPTLNPQAQQMSLAMEKLLDRPMDPATPESPEADITPEEPSASRPSGEHRTDTGDSPKKSFWRKWFG